MSGFNVGAVIAHIKADISDFQKGIAKVQAETAVASDKLAGFGKVGAAAFVAVGTAAAALAFKLAKTSIEQAAAYEQTQVAFSTMLGDAEKANKLLADIADAAKKTPFQLPELEEGAKRLLAYGTAAEDLVPTLTMLGDVTAGLGTEKMPQLILAFGQIQAKGRLMGSELRQLTETGFNLAEAMGITNGKLEDMVSNGEVSFDMVKQAFIDATSEGGKFFNLMENQSQTFSGQVSNLEDELTLMSRDIGMELLPIAKELVAWARDSLVPALKEGVAWIKDHKEEIKAIFQAMWLVIKVTVEVIGTLLKFLVSNFKGAKDDISSVINILKMVFGAFSDTWGAATSFVRSAIQQLVSTFLYLKNMVDSAMKAVFDSITGWLTKAWDKAKQIAHDIREAIASAFDTKKKNSPSIEDRLRSVVQVSEDILGSVNIPSFSHALSEDIGGLQVAGAGGITINLAGAIIADEASASRMAELLGDKIIGKLQKNVRF